MIHPRWWDAACAGAATHVALVAVTREGTPWPLRVGIVSLHLTVAWLFLRRRPAERRVSADAITAALPSLGLGLAPLWLRPLDLGLIAQAMFLTGALGASASLLALGRSFGVLPARRELITRGPYRWIRHPAYLFEWLMFVSLMSGAGVWMAGPLGTAAALALLLRIRAEERLWSDSTSYAAYRARVPYRLLPGLY